jgi:hypothetical protein
MTDTFEAVTGLICAKVRPRIVQKHDLETKKGPQMKEEEVVVRSPVAFQE